MLKLTLVTLMLVAGFTLWAAAPPAAVSAGPCEGTDCSNPPPGGGGGGGGGGGQNTNKCGDVETAFDFNCPQGTNSESEDVQRNPIYAFLVAVINFLAAGVGIVVVGGIVWGAITYISANGNSGKTQQGINMIVNSFIGLIMFIFMYAVLNYLVPGGLIG